MRTALFCILSFALASTIAPAKDADKTSPSVDSSASPCTPIAFLVGGTWHGQVPPGPNEQKVEIELKADWTENHQGIRFDSTFVIDGKGSPYASGIYAWNPAKKQLVVLYTDSKASLADGAVTIKNGVLVHNFSVIEKDGKISKIQARVTPLGPNAYLNEIYQWKHGHWEKLVSVHYERAA
jgi:hypothetical protein